MAEKCAGVCEVEHFGIETSVRLFKIINIPGSSPASLCTQRSLCYDPCATLRANVRVCVGEGFESSRLADDRPLSGSLRQ